MGKIKASSLLEIVVALVLITAVFSIGLMIMINVLRTTYTPEAMRISGRLEELAGQTKREKTFFDEQIAEGTIRFYKEVSAYSGTARLWRLRITAVNAQGNILQERNELIDEDR